MASNSQRVTKQKPPTPAPKASPAPLASPAKVAPRRVTEEEIRTLAYFKWDQAGRPDGDAMKFWFEAERELDGGR